MLLTEAPLLSPAGPLEFEPAPKWNPGEFKVRTLAATLLHRALREKVLLNAFPHAQHSHGFSPVWILSR